MKYNIMKTQILHQIKYDPKGNTRSHVDLKCLKISQISVNSNLIRTIYRNAKGLDEHETRKKFF